MSANGTLAPLSFSTHQENHNVRLPPYSERADLINSFGSRHSTPA